MSSKPCLPRAVLAERAALPETVREAIRPLTGSRPAYFIRQLVIAWAPHAGSVWVSAFAIFVVATLQNVLALLVHEQAHCLGFRPRSGDLVANLFAAYPLLLLTVEGYARVHLSHHKYFFTERDLDHLRKQGEEWTIPMSPKRLLGLLILDALGLNVLKLVRQARQGRRGRRILAQDAPAMAARVSGCRRDGADTHRYLASVPALLAAAAPDGFPVDRTLGRARRTPVQSARRERR